MPMQGSVVWIYTLPITQFMTALSGWLMIFNFGSAWAFGSRTVVHKDSAQLQLLSGLTSTCSDTSLITHENQSSLLIEAPSIVQIAKYS